MAVLSDYVTGTINLTNGSVNFTGTGTGWEAADFKEGDTIIDITGATEFMGVVATITGEATGTLTKSWEGPTLTNVAYRLRYQPDGTRATAQARLLIELLGNGNLTALASLSGSANRVPMFTGPGAMTLVPKTDLVSGANYNVQVANLAARTAYDGQDEGFAVLVSDVGDGRAAIYSKVSATSGDWSDAAYVTGPVGPIVTIEAGTTTTLPTGSDATFNVVPVPGGYQLDAGIPRGLQGNPGNTGPAGQGLEVDATGLLADRDDYDSEPEGFVYVATDVGELFFRQTSTPGVWSDPIEFAAGPPGDSGALITTTNGVGDGTDGPYTLDAAPLNEESVWVSISGVIQYNYNIVGTQITFGQNVPVGVPWQVKTSGPLPVSEGVTGPLVSVDGNIALFDGTDGKTIKDAGIGLDDLTYVKYDAMQSLTPLEKGQVRGNIGADLLGGFRNKTTNGDFDVWQRGTSFGPSTTDQYTADRWLAAKSGATATISRQLHTLGQTAVPGNPTYFLRYNVSGADNNAGIYQRFEEVKSFSGKKITITFYLKHVTTAATNLTLQLSQVFGTGGSPSPTVNTTVSAAITTTTSWTKKQFVVDVPSISGKTLGTAGDYLQFGLFNPTNQIFDFDISHVSLVEGDATAEIDPFSPRHIQQELALCQRYYENATISYFAMPYRTANMAICVPYSVRKRTTPTVTLTVAAGTFSGITASIDGFFATTDPLDGTARYITGWQADAEF